MTTRTICCTDLSVHVRCGHVAQGGHLGYALVVYESQQRRLVPMFHCPWCGTELQPKGERSDEVSVYAP